MIKFINIFIVLFVPLFAFSQYSTTAFWMAAKANVEFMSDFELTIENGYRLDENLSELSKAYIQTSVSYKTRYKKLG